MKDVDSNTFESIEFKCEKIVIATDPPSFKHLLNDVKATLQSSGEEGDEEDLDNYIPEGRR